MNEKGFVYSVIILCVLCLIGYSSLTDKIEDLEYQLEEIQNTLDYYDDESVTSDNFEDYLSDYIEDYIVE